MRVEFPEVQSADVNNGSTGEWITPAVRLVHALKKPSEAPHPCINLRNSNDVAPRYRIRV